MPTEHDPIIGNWYENREKAQKFEVVALDEDNGLVDIQYFDGDLDELDLDTWYELDITATDAPDDWTKPVDDVQKDVLGTTEDDEDEEARDVATKPRRSRRMRLSDEVDELDQDEDDDESDELWEDET